MTFSIIKNGTTYNSDYIFDVNYFRNINPSKNIVAGCVSASSATVRTSVDLNVGDSFTLKCNDKILNVFYVDEKMKIGVDNIHSTDMYRYTCYDAINKLTDSIVDNWTAPSTWSISNMLSWIGTNTGFAVSADATLPNLDLTFTKKPFYGQNITARVLLENIVSLTGGVCFAHNNTIYVTKLNKNTAVTVSDNILKSKYVGDETISAISGVHIGASLNDVGYTYPANATGNILHIIGNNLVGTSSNKTGVQIAQAIYNMVHNYSYTPVDIFSYDVNIVLDNELNKCTPVKVDNKTCYVFETSISLAGCSLKSSGDNTNDSNSRITVLKSVEGKSYELTQDVNGLKAVAQEHTTQITNINALAVEAKSLAETADNKAETADAKAVTAKGVADQAIADAETAVADALAAKQIAELAEGGLEVLEPIVTNLSGTVETHTTNINTLTQTATEIGATVSGHTTLIGELEDETGDIRTDLTGTQTNLSSLSVTVDGISGTVSQHTDTIATIDSEIDALDATVTTHSSNISSLQQTATEISAAVSAETTNRIADVNGERTRATNAESALSIRADGITTRVAQNETDISGHGTRISNAESSISQQATKIALVVDSSDTIKAASIVAAVNDAGSSVKIDADHIELGGTVVVRDNAEVQTTLSILNPDPEAPSGPIILSNDEYGLYISTDNGPADVTLGTVDSSNIYVSTFMSKCLGISYTSVRQFLIDLDDYVYNQQPGTFYTISTSVSPSGAGYTEGGGKYLSGDTCTLTAYAFAGYSFNGWYSGSTRVSTSATYSFTVTSNRTLTARFSGSFTRTIQLRVSSDWDSGYWSLTPMGSDITSVTVPYDGSVMLYFCRDCCECDPVGENFEWEVSSLDFCDRPIIKDRQDDYAILEVTGVVGNGTITAIQGG